jgi:hypothetical protein
MSSLFLREEFNEKELKKESITKTFFIYWHTLLKDEGMSTYIFSYFSIFQISCVIVENIVLAILIMALGLYLKHFLLKYLY